MRLVWGIVTSIEHASEDIQLLEVSLDDRTVGPAIAFPRLSGICGVAERVLVNATGSELDSAGGVRAIVVARAGSTEGTAHEHVAQGRTLKLRHTPMQVDVACVEERDNTHHATMRSAQTLAGMPVACCGLPGQVFAVAVAAKATARDARIAFVMSDEGALTLAVSDAVRAARATGLISTTVTCGQAIGGELEALNVHSGLLAARHAANADIAILAPGPGVPSTATPFGHIGVSQGNALNAVSSLGGVPVAVLRLLSAVQDDGAWGVHPQSLIALGRVALSRAVVPVPPLPDEFRDGVDATLEDAGLWNRHVRVDVDSVPSSGQAAIRGQRGRAEDPASALAASAAGVLCARYASGEAAPDVRLPDDFS
ncbi:MAG: DUF3866 family protein [Coriobacteriia bacterium]|nr:DUF3866 family protein [Coriobacteriia bacterium]